jgi:hypothetical protein
VSQRQESLHLNKAKAMRRRLGSLVARHLPSHHLKYHLQYKVLVKIHFQQISFEMNSVVAPLWDLALIPPQHIDNLTFLHKKILLILMALPVSTQDR